MRSRAGDVKWIIIGRECCEIEAVWDTRHHGSEFGADAASHPARTPVVRGVDQGFSQA